MATRHQYGCQNHIVNGVNGVNGDNGSNGGDELPQEPQPSTSGGAIEEPRLPRFRNKGIFILSRCRYLLYRLARQFGSQGLGQRTLDAIYCALSYAERIIAWANDAASQSQSDKWYIMMPLKIYLMVTRTGLELADKYLDIRLPLNQYLVQGLHILRTTLRDTLQDSSRILGPDIELPEVEPCCVGPVLSPYSSVSSLSVLGEHSSEEERAQADNSGDKSMYFSVEQLKEQGDGMEIDVEDDKREKAPEQSEEKSEETKQKGKVEAGRPATAADETGAAAKSTE